MNLELTVLLLITQITISNWFRAVIISTFNTRKTDEMKKLKLLIIILYFFKKDLIRSSKINSPKAGTNSHFL